MPLELPVASTFDPIDPELAPLTISVDADANWMVGGNVVDLPALKSILVELRGKMGSDAAIRIRTDAMVQYRFVEPVLREAALAGVTDAAIAVRQEAQQ